MSNEIIDSAIRAWQWCADANNSEPLPPMEDSPEMRQAMDALWKDAEITMVPVDARMFSVNALHKAKFNKATKETVNGLLALLAAAGVVGCAFECPSGSRTKEMRHISGQWRCTDNPEALARLEQTLREKLAEIVEAKQAEARQLEAAAAAKAATQAVGGAMAIYDWACDPENVEIDYLNRRVISLGRLSKAFPEPDSAVALLRQHGIIGQAFAEPNARARTLIPLVDRWFERGARERVEQAITPKPPEPHKQYGPLRVLHPCVTSCNGSLMRFEAGQIVNHEHICRALVLGGAPVAHIDDVGACMCPVTTCRHRFDISESKAPGHPVLIALKNFYCMMNGVTVNIRQGDVISRFDLVQKLLKDNCWPVLVAAEVEYAGCPKCGQIARRKALLGEVIKNQMVAS